MENIDDSPFIDEFSIKNEEKVKAGENLTTKNSMFLAQQAEKAVCKINFDNGHGSGFFCSIKYGDENICCLFTNNHVITEDMIKNDEYIEIKLNNKNYKISMDLKRRIWTDKNIDYTCIEIIEKNNILSEINPFELDKNNYNIQYYIKNIIKEE